MVVRGLQWWFLHYNGGSCITMVVRALHWCIRVLQWWLVHYIGGSCITLVVRALQWWLVHYIGGSCITLVESYSREIFLTCLTVKVSPLKIRLIFN